MFGGVNLFLSSARFAGPRASLAPMGGAAHRRLRYGVLSHLWLWGVEGLGTGPRGGPSLLGYPGSLGGFPAASRLSMPVAPPALSSPRQHAPRSLYVHPPNHYRVLERHPAPPAAAVYITHLHRVLPLPSRARRFPSLRLVIRTRPAVECRLRITDILLLFGLFTVGSHPAVIPQPWTAALRRPGAMESKKSHRNALQHRRQSTLT